MLYIQMSSMVQSKSTSLLNMDYFGFYRYNSLDQLVCVLCNSVIKSSLLWPAHLQSRGHKEVNFDDFPLPPLFMPINSLHAV